MPFYKNWRGFVGWVQLSVLGSLRKLFPKLMPNNVETLVIRGHCTARQGMQKLKRDAVVFLSALHSESLIFVDFACSSGGCCAFSVIEIPRHPGS